MIYSKFEWNWPAGSGEKKIKKIIPGFFSLSLLSPPGEGWSPSFEQNWIFTSPKDDLCQIWLKLVQWFWRRFLNDPTPFLHFCDYHHFEEDLAFSLFEQSWIPFTQGWFVPSLIEFGPVVLKIFFKKISVFFTLSLSSPLGEGWSPPFAQIWILFSQGWFVPSLVKIGPVVPKKKWKM
jgi:hypothetical protein